ncbi:peptidoglycan-binding protein [Xanthomonas arboricola pv. juglandis]|uniref:XVIPCD domain-containing protein n=1 Tax=Xanthomonas euroxanthea TaxID=2259622 RepID=UPI000E87A07C|nr:XVIPCD domain-containing protein [Xanthomonas euroxanthea]SYZ57861.1 peptidoglycan-binding protein [Xanthomonas arboricola pv. juglandis]
MSRLTDQELRATLYFAVGVSSESGYAAYQLEVAGDNLRTPLLEPADNSGYTIGTIQTDLGQHYQPNMPNGENVPRDLVNAYQQWAHGQQQDLVLSQQQVDQTIADLGRNGGAIRVDAGRPLDAEVKSKLDTFLSSNEGISWVHQRDVAQIDKLMDRAIAPLQRSELYQNASLDDQVKLATMVGKTYNQNETRTAPMIRNIEANQYHSLADVSAAIDDLNPRATGRGDYLEAGRDKALEGADVVTALRNADSRSPLATAWTNVVANPLVDPTTLNAPQAGQNLAHEYHAVKNLFLHYSRAEEFVGALDRGATYQNASTDRADPTRFNGAGFYAAGNDLVTWDKTGQGHAFLNDAWSGVERQNLARVRNDDGTTDLNINENGQARRLLHVDPHANPLRGSEEPAQPTLHDQPPVVPRHGSLFPSQNPLHRQAEDAVRRLEQGLGREYDDNSARLAASSAYLAKDNGLTRIDHVVLSENSKSVRQGENLFVVEGALNDPSHKMAHMKTNDAIAQPVEQSLAQLQSLGDTQRQQQSQQQEQQREQSITPPPRMV